MEQYLAVIAPGAVALILSILAYLKSRIDNKRLKERLDNIVDVLHDEEEQFYVKCLTCNNKIMLKDAKIYVEKKKGV